MSKSRNKKAQARPRGSAATLPWVHGGINYGPAIGAVSDLAAWAFDLAEGDVADWPEGRRRVRSARRYVLDRIGGRGASRAPADDILFTAGLLARIFEADLSLGMTEMVSILDQLGLPTDVVPLMPRPQRHPRDPADVIALARRRRASPPDPDTAPCPLCPHGTRFRNAA